MLDVAIMIEGQNGLNWSRWQRIARAVEVLGFAGLYRSDHYTNSEPPDLDSLELWVSLTWLAANTRRIQFGPLVSPVSFRHPTMTARMAVAVDELSGGRLVLGIGAGWQEREHRNYGWQLLDKTERFQRFEEGLEIIQHLVRSAAPLDYNGKYYQLKEAVVLPRPLHPGGIPILVGGNGPNRTLDLVARYADEWNAVLIPPDQFARLNARLDERIQARGRPAGSVRRSMMTGCIFARDQAALNRKISQRWRGKLDAGELKKRGFVVGGAQEVVDQLNLLAEAGVQRIMLQWLELDDLDDLEAMAYGVLPHFQKDISA